MPLKLQQELDLINPAGATPENPLFVGVESISRRELEDEGWTYCGSGIYAQVFVRGERALKIFEATDIAYASWIANAPNDGGPYPRRLSEVMPVHYHNGVTSYNAYGVVLERLNTSSDDVEYATQRIRNALAHAEVHGERDINLGLVAPNIDENLFEAIAFALELIDQSPTPKFYLDLRGANVMVRPSTGELVLTDPIAIDASNIE